MTLDKLVFDEELDLHTSRGRQRLYELAAPFADTGRDLEEFKRGIEALVKFLPSAEWMITRPALAGHLILTAGKIHRSYHLASLATCGR
ncbi:MAG: hypothetical protein ACE5IZ_11330 [Dehalococcoidia bacterium]